ncbi:Tetratricopeptide repeat protein [Anatilimnocola aggregata]|uniref:Tetratricopeptide repeat protein n=1 Tax=Anatilimnocola aggregata TaxID=2528021 RepID=A0A517Y9R8_9BACT|nr:tetratricopeptide repeat protein [Anatilimnocola aggregata]QDU26980.1 Tetratricopeptide repeat protein [Anatilimnocola aggregata]
MTDAHGSTSQVSKARFSLAAVTQILPAARRSPLKVGLPLALGLVAFIVATYYATSLYFLAEPEKVTVADVLAPLDEGLLQEARQQAAELRSQPDLDEELQSACLFVLGSVLAEEAEKTGQPTQRRLLNLIAARYLDQSRQIGLPKDREAQGVLTLARAFYRANRYVPAATMLAEALAKNPDSAIELEHALTDCYLKMQPPQPKVALTHIERLLRLPGISPRQRDEAHLLAANVHFTANNTAACEASLAQVLDTSSVFPQAQALAARVQLQRLPPPKPGQSLGTAEQQPLQTLIAELQPLAERKGLEQGVAAQLSLLLAQCHERLGKQKEAAHFYGRIRKLHHGSPEAVASTFLEADWLAGAGQVEESLTLYRRGLQEAEPSEDYDNHWLPRQEIERRLEAAIRRYQELKSFAEAAELAEAAASLVALPQTLLWRAEIERAWAADLLDQQKGRSREEKDLLQAQARTHLREAAARDRELAAARVATRNFPDDLLRSATTYLQGYGYQQAEQGFRQFLQQQTREGQPEALIGLGQALLAQGRTSEALATLDQVQQMFDKHPANYQARLLAAAALQEQGDLSAARELLNANLFGSALTPQSTEWRDSLFALGHIQFRQGMTHEARSRNVPPQETEDKRLAESLRELEIAAGFFEEAIKTLTEATQRFPAASQSIAATYEVAEAYRHAAKWPRQRLQVVTIDSTRQTLNRQLTSDLNSAVAEYTRLIERLSDDQESSRATVDLKVLRNCYFNRADALFDLGRYEEAIQAYSAATNRYQHEPESLEAYVQIATCYRRLQRYAEARGTLEQARVVLERIRKDADFAKTTRFDRQQWIQLLEWFSTL